jgi:hypothetical protein
MLPGMRGASFRSRKRLAVSSKRYSCSKNIEAPGQHQQCVEQVAVVTEAIPASGDRLQILSLDRRVEVVGYVLDNFVTRTARCDIPAVAPDWQCERQEQRGDLRVGAHRAVRVYRVRLGQLGNRLGRRTRTKESDRCCRDLPISYSSAVAMRQER